MSMVIVDDRFLVKSPPASDSDAWFLGGGGAAVEYNGTTSAAKQIGATLTYKFNGTQVTVFGTLDGSSGGMVASYSLNGNPAALMTYAAVNPGQHRQPLWSSEVQIGDQHQLVITAINVTSTSSPGSVANVYFDYLVYLPLDGETSGGSTTTVTTVSTITTTTISQTSGAAPLTLLKASQSATIGVSIGGTLFLVGCVASFLFFLRHCRSKWTQRGHTRDKDDVEQNQPFMPDRNPVNPPIPYGGVTAFSIEACQPQPQRDVKRILASGLGSTTNSPHASQPMISDSVEALQQLSVNQQYPRSIERGLDNSASPQLLSLSDNSSTHSRSLVPIQGDAAAQQSSEPYRHRQYDLSQMTRIGRHPSTNSVPPSYFSFS